MGISVVGGSTTSTQDKTVVYGNPGTYTFTPPAGTSTTNPLLCEVTLVGGGGGGGNYSTNGTTGQGGGAAQIVKQSRVYITGATTVTVGAGGAAATNGGNSTFAGITALGGYGGSASTSSTSKNTGMDDTTKGAGGKSAVNVMFTSESGVPTVNFKSIGDLGTSGNLTQQISPPPFSGGSGRATTAYAGDALVYCIPYVSGTSNGWSGGNNTAFYNSNTSTWTIRSTPALSGGYHCVVSIGTTAVCFPQQSTGNNTAYYYATAGQTTWSTAYIPVSGGSGQTWYLDKTKDSTEFFATNYARTAAAKTNDGINWTTFTLPTEKYGNGGSGWIQWMPNNNYYIYIPTGDIGNGGTVYTSPNLSTWTSRTISGVTNGNTGDGNGGLIGLGTDSSYVFWRGNSSSASYPNTWYSSNGYSWGSLGFINDSRTGPGGHAMPTWYASKNNFIVQGMNAYSGNSYTALIYSTGWNPSTQWYYPSTNVAYQGISLVALPGISNAVPTTFPGISDFEPTGGSSGVPSAGGDGGDGGSYLAPTVKSTVASAAATPGQVPGAGGGGGGAGSPNGAAGAAGLVSIKYYG